MKFLKSLIFEGFTMYENIIIKQIPEDFYVKEIYDESDFLKKDESKNFHYLILKKRNYNQIRAIDLLAKLFKIKTKNIHFAGTKDKNAITEQIISVNNIGRDRLIKSIEYINENIKDIDLVFLESFPGRINLGDLKKNFFKIVVRNIERSDIKEKLMDKVEVLRNKGIVNYFDEQRFGFANNSQNIGLFIIKNQIKKAIYEIFTSKPKNPSEKLVKFIELFKREYTLENFDVIIENLPKFLEEYKPVLEHLKIYNNDSAGAFRKLHKKLRTLYINALQSSIWNNVAKDLYINLGKGKLWGKSLELVGYETDIESSPFRDFINKELNNLSLEKEDFFIKHMPELSSKGSERKLIVFPEELKLEGFERDELNKGKYKAIFSFYLIPGAYATVVIKELFI